MRVVACEPLLAVICALFTEGERQRLIGGPIPLILDFVELLEPLLSLCGSARAQTLVVFEGPAAEATLAETLAPPLKFALGIEAAHLSTLSRLQKRSGKRADEA